MKISLNKDVLVNKFLSPISKVAERCVVTIYPDRIESLVANNDVNPILYAQVYTPCDIGSNESVTLNVANINKLRQMLNCINTTTVELTLNGNSISYDSSTMKFKYHLLEDGVIVGSPINAKKLEKFEFDSDFVVDNSTITNIIRSSAFASETNKLYFYMKDGTVYAELTDNEIANTDSATYAIANEYNGTNVQKSIIIDLEIFKQFQSLKCDATAMINTTTRLMMFKFEENNYVLKYFVAPLTR